MSHIIFFTLHHQFQYIIWEWDQHIFVLATEHMMQVFLTKIFKEKATYIPLLKTEIMQNKVS